ncbi:amidohydrolase family protein [Alkalicoccus luteus]|uniref:Amidohydrolase n=1 Tax=Alkalicoccus luteus TaxID=1237094 RepID=A0A969TUV6_9BACI|nr:amidohydrolase [Alkalicoccus luteus]NJP39113.1 amidohydrolase [Alkalicoccus luteus]
MLQADRMWTGAHVLTMEPGEDIIKNGAVAVKDNRIVAVGTSTELAKTVQAVETIDAGGKLIMPGLIDAHIHSSYAVIRGVAQDMDHWMQKGIWPWMKYMSVEDRLAGSRMNLIEGIRAGTTTFADYDREMDSLLDQNASLGVRIHAAEMINELPDDVGDLPVTELYPLDREAGERRLKAGTDLYDKWHGAENGRITVLLGPQGPDMMSLDLLQRTKAEAEKRGVRMHMHVCQGDRELYQLEKRYKKRSIAFLDEQGLLNEQLTAAHLTEANDEETAYAASKGVNMIHCPGSIGIIDGIVPPVQAFLKAGGKAAIGTDQAPGNNSSNMFQEIKAAAVLNKVKAGDPKVFPARQALHMATLGAAEVHGLDREIGSLRTGKKADFIVVNLATPALTPALTNPVDTITPNLVYAASGEEVEDVIVDGRYVMRERKLVHADEAEAVNRAQQRAERLAQKVTF